MYACHVPRFSTFRGKGSRAWSFSSFLFTLHPLLLLFLLIPRGSRLILHVLSGFQFRTRKRSELRYAAMIPKPKGERDWSILRAWLNWKCFFFSLISNPRAQGTLSPSMGLGKCHFSFRRWSTNLWEREEICNMFTILAGNLPFSQLFIIFLLELLQIPFSWCHRDYQTVAETLRISGSLDNVSIFIYLSRTTDAYLNWMID